MKEKNECGYDILVVKICLIGYLLIDIYSYNVVLFIC